MKTQFFRVPMGVLAVSGLVLCPAWLGEKSQAEVPVSTPAPVLNPPAARQATNQITVTATTNLPAGAIPAVKVVEQPVAPDDLKASPALEEVVKLVQAGVSEEVTLAYISSAPRPFNLSSDQIVYLNDLGVSTTVITSLLQHDSSPAPTAEQSGVANPLPPGVALTTPAANLYPPYASAPAPQPGPPPADPNAPNNYATAPLVPPDAPADTSYFYNSLSPYGSWIDVDGYGLCWQPTVAVVSPGWRPYCDRGRWLWTDCGWYWYSDYSWGWAPFHYGRWCSHPRAGWFWVPDTCWGPSWVSWRYTSSHCGWAPLPPAARFVSGVGFSFHGGSVGVGFDFGIGAGLYTFVPFSRFHDPYPYRYAVASSRASVIYQNSTVVNNYIVQKNGTVINHGVGVDRVSQASGRKITAVAIRTATQTATASSARYEHLHSNGSALTVVRPNLAMARPSPVSSAIQAGSNPGHASTSRLAPAPRSVDTHALRSSQETAAPLRNQEPVGSGSIVSLPAVSARATPQNRSIPNGDQTASSQSIRTPPPVTAPAASQSEIHRVYPEPGFGARPGNPHVEPAVPQSRPSYGGPREVAPYRAIPGVPATPNYRPEASHSPVYRSEPAHAPASAPPAASHSAPSGNYSTGGARSGSNKNN